MSTLFCTCNGYMGSMQLLRTIMSQMLYVSLVDSHLWVLELLGNLRSCPLQVSLERRKQDQM